jgi:hypothetical protein
VITREIGPPAVLALTMEGLEITEIRMRDYTNYGRVFTEQWQSGHGFMVVEEDIVPWPGAMLEMDRCEQEWCGFEFPNGIVQEEPRSGFCVSLGCMKFSDSLVKRYQYSDVWQNRGWDELDGAVFEILQDETVHVHSPPVAHAKLIALRSRREALPL